MKAIYALLLIIMICPTSQGQSLKNRYYLHRACKDLGKRKFDNMDVYDEKLSEWKDSLPQPYLIKRTYFKYSIGDFKDFDKTLDKLQDDTLDLKRLYSMARQIEKQWITLKRSYKKKLNRKYYNVYDDIEYWNRRLKKALDSARSNSPKKEDDLPFDVEDYNNYKREKDRREYYESPAYVKALAKEMRSTMDSLLGQLPKETKVANYKILIKRAGEKGKDVIMTIQARLNKKEKFYPLGEYQSDPIDILFRKFAISVRYANEGSSTSSATGKATGEADAFYNGLSPNMRYDIHSDIWGAIDFILIDGTEIHLTPNQMISNRELAFLRAYNVKYIFEKETPEYPIEYIEAIDYSQIDPSKKDPQGTYRNASIEFYFTDFYKDSLESFSSASQKLISDQYSHEESIIHDSNITFENR